MLNNKLVNRKQPLTLKELTAHLGAMNVQADALPNLFGEDFQFEDIIGQATNKILWEK
jgi:hypothetical protein